MCKYPVVTLCGSAKYKDQFIKIQKELTLKGYIVFSLGFFGQLCEDEAITSLGDNAMTRIKCMLMDMHKTKIDMSDEIFVINPNGYIGNSTWTEICYAYKKGKAIIFLEEVGKSMLEEKIETFSKMYI